MVTPRLRYTHYIVIYSNTSALYDGLVAASMTPSVIQPNTPFKLELAVSDTSDITGIKITGTYDGSGVTENITLNGEETKYSSNTFDSIVSLVSKSFDTGTSILINAVDDAYQPIFWETESDPYKCTFSTVDGMSSGIQPEPIGLRTIINHYVRLPLKAPVSKNMEFRITPMGLQTGMYNPYEDKRYVAITDFDIVCIPPRYLPIERAFRATEKTGGNDD